MAAPSGSYDELAEQSTILLKDVVSMFVIDRIPRNEKPYKAAVLRFNNEIVREWASTVGERLADSEGKVAAGKASVSLSLFVEWKEMLRFCSLRREGLVMYPNHDLVNRWRKIFEEESIESMCKNYGSGCTVNGWNLIESYMKIHHAEYMWDNFWSKSEDPLWFVANAQLLKNLRDDYPSPFWTREELTDHKDMMMTMIRTPIEAKK